MTSFQDKSGNAWPIDLTIGAVLRIKTAEKRFDLLEPQVLAEKLATDEAEFWELLWHVVAPHAEMRGITPQQFADDMSPACLHNARVMFFQQWADFFRQLHRLDKAAVVEKTAEYLAKAIELTKAKFTGPEMSAFDQLVEAKMTSALNASFGELRASLASTPAPSPGGN